jgi:DHA1 family bicyclomycin/chloramphenicol resistance-like MFS transporter
MMSVSGRSYSMWWIALLGMLTALAPLSIDMYLPALPQIADSLSVSTALVSNTVPAYFFGLAIGQLIYGPISDRIGRKIPLYFGLSIFVVASVLCAFSNQIELLIAARVLQAFGGCVGVVIARAAIRDRLSPTESVQAYSLLILVMGLAPILAPLMGSVLLQWVGWRGIFMVLALFGVFCLVMIYRHFEETLVPAARRQLTLPQVFASYADLLKDHRFRTPALAGGALMAVMYCYITVSSALFMAHFKVTPQQFSLIFGFNAAGLIAISQLNGFLVKKVGLLPLLHFGASMQLFGVVLLLCLEFSGHATLSLTMLSLFFIVSGIGFTAPNSTAIALSLQGHRAGMASALLGAIQFGFGLLAGVIVFALPFDLLRSMSIVMLFLVVFASIAIKVLRWRERRLVNIEPPIDL